MESLELPATEINVDVILKVTKVSSNKKKLEFVDKDGDQYQINVKVKSGLKKGVVIKFKCVKIEFSM